ncbi:hypothetical protein [Methanoplanus endosymbiosus]|uniref:Uncharacterized protein n=1 Tax=Methanoplanus endosymbiosus TaxID=33865 RepID=A0A9E7PRD2_9EURY|nr:hypothetical protein [Methanoplanus endosymbiosus]UUX92137.1 hypothetical protein L6E24_12370 [Methanoplanus endosymbiosus]
MKKSTVKLVAVLSLLVCIGAEVMLRAGIADFLTAAVLMTIAFPPFVLFTGLWWKAGEGERDIPFIGY